MRLLSHMAKEYLPQKEEPKLIHAIQDVFVLKYQDTPIMSTDCVCPMCGGNEGHVVYIDPIQSDKRMWFCQNDDCLALVTRSRPKTCQIIPKTKRELEWPLFCEINDLGDLVYDVKFESINQSSAKVEYLLKFAKTPKGIIVMQGKPGTGKTYAAMALCELFTRTNRSCLFFTGEKLCKKWLDTFKQERPSSLRDRVMETNLLVIDDFGTGEPSPGFMQFFMEIINTRMQWSNRGTVITTNLNESDFSKFCGNALSDRINTGQKFEFTDKSRRKQTIL